MNKVLFNLCRDNSWGDKCLSLGLVNYHTNIGDLVTIVTKFNNNSNASTGNLYSPSKEPLDFFMNLIVPTFKCKYYDINTGIKTEDYDDSGKYDIIYNNNVVGKEYDENILEFINSKKATQFQYKLCDEKKDENYKFYFDILKKTKNIILYADWDDDLKFNKVKDRKRGLDLPSYAWEQMQSSVLAIDDFCLKNPEYRIILFNKKAVDWEKIIKSNYFDMRYFEKYNLTFSQAFELCVNNSISTIGSWSSPQVWFNFATGKKHIVYFKPKPWRLVRNLCYFSIDSIIT